MPKIQTYSGNQAVPGGSGKGRISRSVAGQVGRAMAGFGQSVSDVGDVFEAFAEAKRKTDAANHSTEGARQLGLKRLEHEQSASPNIEAFTEEAEKIRKNIADGITDKAVLRAFNSNYNSEFIEADLAVRKAQRKRFIEGSVGSLDASLSKERNLHVQATSDEQRDLVVERALGSIQGRVDSGVIGKDDAVNMEQKFRGGIELDQAKLEGLIDAKGTIEKLQKGGYPNIEESQRLSLWEKLQRKRDSDDRRAIAAEEKADRKGEKAKKLEVQQNDLDLTRREFKGELGTDTLEEHANNRGVSLPMYRWVRDRWEKGEEVEDNPIVVAELWSNIMLGRDVTGAVLSETYGRNISDDTHISMIKTIADKSMSAGESRIASAMKPSDLDFNRDKHRRYSDAQKRYQDLIRGGEKPREAAEIVVGEYLSEQRRSKKGLPKPTYLDGDKGDSAALVKAEELTVNAFRKKTIELDEFNHQIAIIEQLKDIATGLANNDLSHAQKQKADLRLKR